MRQWDRNAEVTESGAANDQLPGGTLVGELGDQDGRRREVERQLRSTRSGEEPGEQPPPPG